MGADLPDLTLEREHVGEEPQIQHHGGIPFLRGGVLLGLLQHALETGKQLQAHRNEAAIHRDCHGTLLLEVGGNRSGLILAARYDVGKSASALAAAPSAPRPRRWR